MARNRTPDIVLPEHVHHVKSGGRSYFYYQTGRGRPKDERGPRIKIHGDPYAAPESDVCVAFWAEIKKILADNVRYPSGSLGALIEEYKADDAYTSLAPHTQEVYAIHLGRMQRPEAWGFLPADAITTLGVKKGRDALKGTPGMANQMLSVGRLLYDWGMLYNLAKSNPFDKVPPLETGDRGHIPWPAWAIDYVSEHATQDLVRMVRLGIATCQRESDFIRMGPDHRAKIHASVGIWCRPQKTKRHRKAVFIPLTVADALMLDAWVDEPMVFTASRFKEAYSQHRTDLYLYSPRGRQHSPTSLRARWNRWLATPEGQSLCTRWRTWLEEMKRRYEWDIDPEDARGPTIHGLRGTGFLKRFAAGFDTGQIANDVGASRQTIEHYMRFRDQVAVAAGGTERMGEAKKRTA